MLDLRQGNVLDVLRGMADESIHCIVTSPPYWGLRAYGTEPQVWLNGREPCAEHTWNDDPKRKSRADYPLDDKQASNVGSLFSTKANTCSVCGAWRGELGLEPTIVLYIEHLVMIFKETMRVLRKDGTAWINLGDSYNSGNNGHGEWTGEKARQGDGEQKKKGMTRKHTDELAPKNLLGVPWRFAFAMQDAGFILRQDIIWAKPNPMPESVTDRCTKSHEYVFMFAKSQKYYFDQDAILEPANYDGRKATMMKGARKYPNGFVPDGANPNTMHVEGHERWSNKIVGRTEKKMEGTGYGGDGTGLHGHSGYHDANGKLRTHLMPPIGGVKKAGGDNPTYSGKRREQVTDSDGIPARNKRDVWMVATHPYKEAHFATFPEKLIEPMVLAGCPLGGIVLDPFSGAGTTGLVAVKHGRNYIGIELKEEYIAMTRRRIEQELGTMELAT